MQLKQMKLSGFKSFVDPMTIDLPSQLIGIVGPNGCGKSNIIDAVRWVLGESSAKNLRGDAMTDVIFNGATARRAVGQASVELRFDNELGKMGGQFNQYQEISIKRTVNRDGDSVYYLNGKRCRKRDVTDLFLGTGAGSRGYSIISQGTISQLIEAKPLTLRAYLEEAAGISKYKDRRRETLQRIEHTKTNLARIEDIRQELDKQVQRLQKQAKTAECYQRLKQEAGQYRIKIAAHKWQDHQSQRSECQKQLESLAQQIEKLKSQHASLINEIHQASETLQSQQQHFNQKQHAFYEHKSSIARIEEQTLMRKKELETTKEQHQQLQNDQLQIAQTIAEEQSKLTTYQQQFELTDNSIIKINDLYEKTKEELESLQNQQSQRMEAYGVLAAKQQSLKHNQQITQLKIEQQNEKQQQWMTQLENTNVQELTQTIKDCQNKSRQLEHTKMNCEKEIESIESSLQSLQADEEGYKQKLAQLKQAIERDETNYQNCLREKTIVDASIDAHSNNEKLSKPPFLEDKSPIFQNISVAPEWQKALQWIAPHLLKGYIIEDAKALPKYKEQLHNCGLVLCGKGQIKQSNNKHTLAHIIKGPIPSSNLKLDTILIADSIEQAFTMFDSLTQDESVLTKDGFWLGKTWLHCMPANTQGAFNLLALAEEQKMLTNQLSNLSEKISLHRQNSHQYESKLQEITESIKHKQIDQNQKKEILQQIQTEITLTQNREHQAKKEKIRLDELTQLCQHELELIVSERMSLEVQLQHTQIELESIKQKLLKFDNLEQQSDEIKKRQENLNHFHQQLQKYQLQKQQLLQSKQNSKQQITYWQTQQEKTNDRLEFLASSLAKFNNPVESGSETDIEMMKAEHARDKTILDDLQSELEEQKQRIQDYQQQADSLQQQATQVEHLFQAAQLQEQETKIHQENAQNQLKHLNISIQDAVNLLDGHDSLAQLNQKYEQCNQRIQQLGAVNLVAKEELDEEMTRKQNLDAQQADLENAIGALHQAINKIDQETKTRFSETFEQVNETFQRLFPTVFGGGSASLRLEGDNWLDNGVIVMAQPPGKRNTSLQLLSGGEKALSAVALVFALFQLNPSPFCLLDEVDAPLDDINVRRFCQLVKQMSDQVQFIFITHNKVTMTLAEHLIGVTMREPGVSRLVSVDVAKAIEMSA